VPDVALLIAALVCAQLGMGWLALAMDVHWRQARGGAPRSAGAARTLRAAGYFALAVSLVLCLVADTATMAVLVWMMLTAVSAATTALILSSRPRWLAPLALGARADTR
jgi:uncharacterized protein DUF3325